MSDTENPVVNTETETATEIRETPAAPASVIVETPPATFLSVKEEVADRLSKSGSLVAGKIIDKMVEDEIKRRTELVTRGFQLLTDLKEQFKKIKPDDIRYNEDNLDKPATRAYSQKANAERVKIHKRIGNLESAIDKAIGEKSDYKKLEELLKTGGEEPKTNENSNDTE